MIHRRKIPHARREVGGSEDEGMPQTSTTDNIVEVETTIEPEAPSTTFNGERRESH